MVGRASWAGAGGLSAAPLAARFATATIIMSEKGSNEEYLKPGDTVVWWKQLPGGDYVYPVKATVVAITAKRVKIEAEDEGQIVTRYVKPQNLQKQHELLA